MYVSLKLNTPMKQDMTDGYAALVFDFTLSESDQSTIMTGPSSKVFLDTLNLTTACLFESSYVFPGWEGVPLEGYSAAGDKGLRREERICHSRHCLGHCLDHPDYRSCRLGLLDLHRKKSSHHPE